MKVRVPKDFWSGLLCVGLASAFIIQARGYPMGTAGQMGPGYFPMGLALVLAGVGAALIARSFYGQGEDAPRLNLFPIVVLVVAICLFGLLIERVGLVVASLLAAVLGARAGPEFHILEAVALALALVAFSVAVFIYALGLPLKVWPSL